MRVYVESYGCSQNQGEADRLIRATAEAGHTIASLPQEADVAVLVTCAVIAGTEERMVRRWRELCRSVPDTVVTGCMVPLRNERFREARPSGRTHLLSIREQGDLPRLLGGMGPGVGARPAGGTWPPPDRTAPLHREIVLNQGCASACSYCFSRLARGPLSSVPFGSLVRQGETALKEGAVELRLSSLDTACWGKEIGTGGPRLPELVTAMARLPAPHEFRVRVGMMSPQTLLDLVPRYWDRLVQEPRVYRFLHLPVQSGSDRVLKGMHRGYRAEDFRRLVQEARQRVKDLTLATDVITGFPGEREEDHRATLDLVRELEPEIVNVTRYSPRPGTWAARQAPVPSRVAKERSRDLTHLRLEQARRRMERWVGRRDVALVVERGLGETVMARLGSYLPVILRSGPPLGSMVPVRIYGARSTYLLGETVGTARG